MSETTSSQFTAGATPMQWVKRMRALGEAVRDRIVQARDAGENMAQVTGQQGGDTIYSIDRAVEPLLVEHATRWSGDDHAILLIAEGLGDTGHLHLGPRQEPAEAAVLIDPIDGTRGLMYDKRSAWFIAAVAPVDAQQQAWVEQSIACVLVELPTSKAGKVDVLAGTGEQLVAERIDLITGRAQPLHAQPSTAGELRHGFAQVSNFFPGTKVLASMLMERIVEATLGAIQPGEASVFDDQYMASGGQMVELIMGRDRFTCDLRPLFYRIIEQQHGGSVRGLECHPYDMGGWLAARQAGVILTDGFGRDLRMPMDVHSPVHWCGYGNASLRQRIEPIIQAFLHEHGLAPDTSTD